MYAILELPEQLEENGVFEVAINFDEQRGNREYYSFRVEYENGVVFIGNQYSPSPLHSMDEKTMVADLVVWTTLNPDENDIERDYTEKQMGFIKSMEGQTLAILAK